MDPWDPWTRGPVEQAIDPSSTTERMSPLPTTGILYTANPGSPPTLDPHRPAPAPLSYGTTNPRSCPRRHPTTPTPQRPRYDSVLGYLVGCSILASVPYHIYGIIKYPGREKEVMMADLGISPEQQAAQSAHV